MSTTADDPGVVRFDEDAEIQTLRGALNAVDVLVSREPIDPPGGIFDPIRLEMARALGDFFADVQRQGAVGEFRLDPSERVTARQALGAVEQMATGPREKRLQAVGLNPNGVDMERIDLLLGRIQYPGPQDLAGTDVRSRLYTEPFEGERRIYGPGQIYADNDPSDIPVTENGWSERVYEFGRSGDCDDAFELLLRLPVLLAAYTGESRRDRQRISEVINDRLNILAGQLSSHDCFTRTDRARISLAASKAADSVAERPDRKPMVVLYEIVMWAQYRRASELTNTDPTGF